MAFYTPTHLAYSIRFKVVGKYVGQLCLITSCLSLVPLIVSLIYQEFVLSICWFVVVAILGILGGLSTRISAPKALQSNESYFIIAAIFIFNSLIMLIPFKCGGMSVIDAWFESVSGITTVGLTTLKDVEVKTPTFLFSRAWMQWFGGIGIVVLSMGLAMQPSLVAKRLSEPLTDEKELVGSSRPHARRMLLIYAVLTVVCFALLWIFELSPFDALTFALSSVSTGGFSPINNSLIGLSKEVQTIVIFFCVLSSISMPLFWITDKKRLKTFFKNGQLWGFLICGCLTALLLLALFPAGGILDAFLSGFSAQSTAGFATMDIDQLSNGSKLMVIGSMIIGGSTQSTAGGIKILRLFILLKTIHSIFFRSSLTKNAVYVPRLGGDKLEPKDRESCLAIVFLFLFATFVSWLCFIIAGYDPINSLFEVVSAIGTGGLTTGISSSGLPSFLKVILCFDMLMGRLELVTFFILFYPRTLFGRRMRS